MGFRVMAVAVLALTLGSNQSSAQTLNPITVNPGVGGGGFGFGGGGIYLGTPQYGPSILYSPPFGYANGGVSGGFFGVVSPGGGFYGAGPGYGGYGVGPWGYNGWDNSVSSTDPYLLQQQYALNASRFDLQTAQIARTYAQANLLQQTAANLSNSRSNVASAPVRPRYNVKSTRSNSARPAVATVPLNRLVSADGVIAWPAVAPADDDRAEVDKALADVAGDLNGGGGPSVRSIVAARQALDRYGHPALAKVRREQPEKGDSFRDFLNNLDIGLANIAK